MLRHSYILLILLCSVSLVGQSARGPNEIPIEHCDRLPVVKVLVGGSKMRFLVDTGSTSMLNIRPFEGEPSKHMEIAAWNGMAETSAREVVLSSFALGKHELKNLHLPAIDLSPIGKACGGSIDGILGIDLMEKMGITLDLKNRLASFKLDPQDKMAAYDEMEAAMHPCTVAFEAGNAKEFEDCLDPEIVLFTPFGNFKGREQVMRYMRERYFKYAPNIKYTSSTHDVQFFGNALWYSYDYSIDLPKERIAGHGVSMCRKSGGRWRILNMHNSLKGQ